jgi:hypothetical protein
MPDGAGVLDGILGMVLVGAGMPAGAGEAGDSDGIHGTDRAGVGIHGMVTQEMEGIMETIMHTTEDEEVAVLIIQETTGVIPQTEQEIHMVEELELIIIDQLQLQEAQIFLIEQTKTEMTEARIHPQDQDLK